MRSTSKIPPKFDQAAAKVVDAVLDLIDSFGFHDERLVLCEIKRWFVDKAVVRLADARIGMPRARGVLAACEMDNYRRADFPIELDFR